MKKQTENFSKQSDGNFELPKGWNPEADRDAQWDSIVTLLREANNPAVPTKSDFEEVLMASKMLAADSQQTAKIESISHSSEKTEDFGPWLKSVTLGGGIYAQVVRFGAIAAATVLVTLSLSNYSIGPLDGSSSNNGVVASADIDDGRSSEGTESNIEIASVSDKPKVALVPATTSSTRSTGNGDMFVVSNDNDWRNMKSDPSWNNALVYSNSSLSQNSGLYGHGFNQRDTRSNDSLNSPEPFAKQKLLNSLQQLRFQSLVNSNPADLETIRQMESALRPLLQEDSAVSRSEIYALELYQKAEDMMAQNRYDDAITILDEIGQVVPSSFMAFLAQFRIASVEFEQMEQYDLALSDYQQVLQDYPTHFLSDSHKTQIMERVELLTQNYEPGWEGLKAWQNAQKLSGKERFDLLKKVVQNHPQLPVASQALESMMRQVLTDPSDQWISPEDVTQLAQFMITASPQHPNGAQILYTQGEIAFRRLYDLNQAKRAFGLVTSKSGGEKYAEAVDRRLTQIARAETHGQK